MPCKNCVRIRDAVLLCNQCRADLELGRLVRAMSITTALYRTSKGWDYNDPRNADSTPGETPEQALRALKGE